MQCPHCRSIVNVGPPNIEITITRSEIDALFERIQKVENGERLVINDPDFKISFIRDDGAQLPKREPKEGNVYYDKRPPHPSKIVVRGGWFKEMADNPDAFEFVCERPHEDGDYSYFCPRNWCRCKQ